MISRGSFLFQRLSPGLLHKILLSGGEVWVCRALTDLSASTATSTSFNALVIFCPFNSSGSPFPVPADPRVFAGLSRKPGKRQRLSATPRGGCRNSDTRPAPSD
jgi:hypothetical protein